ncbi:SRPBCC domain-containing protein [Paenarthrobacter sp. DKR-5]|uniref:SRPBCC domain-containing protein n=1 Tax=Paenarthrobacter sp. DKR-5 TaxID=2835535 RepID=UPI001BDC58AE|nr:SRPBCC domain-containing protein [Paenarthrobacter sp. DKR-5]MBT1002776.1 SRPBCC domain-containing protein [Paenarthrobacter sp. DKR-5]
MTTAATAASADSGPARGAIERTADGYSIHIDQPVAAPPAAVWHTMTEPEAVQRWLGSLTAPWQEHEPYSLALDGGAAAGTVLLLREESELALTWSDELGFESVAAFRLEPQADGTLVRFTAQSPTADFVTEGSAGWQGILEALAAAAEGRGEAPDPSAWLRRRDDYARRYGVSRTMGMPVTEFGHEGLRFDRLIPARRDRVWAALTEPGELLKWFGGAEVDLQVGGTTVFDFGDRQASVVYTEILSEELLEFTSADLAPAASVVRIQLADAANGSDGTDLTLTHLFLAPAAAAPVMAFWHQSLDLLAVDLDERAAHPDEGYLNALTAFYSRLLPAAAH